MSATYFELRVVVTEKPAITFVARCEGITASCTSGGERAARRAVARAIDRSDRLSEPANEDAIGLMLRTHAGYRRTYVARYPLGEVRKCRVCGCTEEDCRQCIERTGEPCCWVEPDLCSACEEAAARKAVAAGRTAAFTVMGRKAVRR